MGKAKRSALGKGLDSMIPKKTTVAKQAEVSKKVEVDHVSRETLIKITDIEPSLGQPRKKFNEDALHELSESIKQHGILQPLLLKKEKKGYRIVAGERRWRAARLAGLSEVPAIIKDYSSQEIIEIALIENIQREDLNPIEEAFAYQNLIQEFHLKQDELAERVSKSRTAITNSMRLLKLCSKVREMVIEEMLSSGHARALIPITNAKQQETIAQKVFDEKLSVRETEKLVRKILSEQPEKPRKKEKDKNAIFYKDLENKIQEVIGTKVSIQKKSNKKGVISLEYYSEEELEHLIELLMSIQK